MVHLHRGLLAIPTLALSLAVTAACGDVAAAPARPGSASGSSTAADAAGAIDADGTLVVAANSGPTLIVLSLTPAAPGDNDIRVDLRDNVDAPVRGAIRVDLALDGAPTPALALPAGVGRSTLRIARAGHADLHITVLDGKSAGASAAFPLDLPAEHVAAGALADIDHAMASLHSLREAQVLSGGGPAILYHFGYLAPDRVQFTTIEPSGQVQETRIIGRDRFDQAVGGGWTHTDIGFASRVPDTSYAHGATDVRIVGRERDGATDLIELAFADGKSYYRVWAGAQDHLVRRYTMMARGHFMSGSYSDYDAPLAISAP